jgi:hypothetical protein
MRDVLVRALRRKVSDVLGSAQRRSLPTWLRTNPHTNGAPNREIDPALRNCKVILKPFSLVIDPNEWKLMEKLLARRRVRRRHHLKRPASPKRFKMEQRNMIEGGRRGLQSFHYRLEGDSSGLDFPVSRLVDEEASAALEDDASYEPLNA